MKSLFKRFDTSGHFPDIKHTAKGQRDNKKIRVMKERRILNGLDDVIETEEYGTVEIWSQNEMEYFFQDKQPEEG